MLWTTKIANLEAQVATLTAERDTALAEQGPLRERLSALEAAGENSPALTAARGQVTALEAEKVSLAANLDAAFVQLEAYKAAIGTDGLFAFAGTADKPLVALTEKGKTSLINSGVTTTLAASGHRALPLAGVDSPAGTVVDANAGKSARQIAKEKTQESLVARGLVTTHTF